MIGLYQSPTGLFPDSFGCLKDIALIGFDFGFSTVVWLIFFLAFSFLPFFAPSSVLNGKALF